MVNHSKIDLDPLIPLDKQRFLGGYNVPPFCGITGIFDDYYGMAITHRLLNHNPLITLYDSWNTVRKSQQDHASKIEAPLPGISGLRGFTILVKFVTF